VGLARGGNAEAREQAHRHGFLDAAGILREVIEHERLQAQKLLATGVAIEVHAQARLGGAARAEPARADADVADGVAVPGQVGRVIGVLLKAGLELGPVRRVQPQLDPLDDLRVEQVVGGLRRRRQRAGQRQDNHDRAHQKVTWSRIRPDQ
jgi:hypothetical protein